MLRNDPRAVGWLETRFTWLEEVLVDVNYTGFLPMFCIKDGPSAGNVDAARWPEPQPWDDLAAWELFNED